MVNVRAVLSQLAELEADVAGDKIKTLDQPSDADILQQALVNSGLSGKDQPAVQGDIICLCNQFYLLKFCILNF
jgi:hypothetical protein